MLHYVKGFLEVVPGACPSLSISEPDKGKTIDAFGLKREGFIAARGFIQLASAVP